MAKWVNTNVHELGLNWLKTTPVQMRLVRTYANNDTWATVTGNTVCLVTGLTGTDFVISGASGASRVLTTTAKTGTATATASSGSDLHVVFTDGTSIVAWATDETTNQQVATGNVIVFPAITYTMQQPT